MHVCNRVSAREDYTEERAPTSAGREAFRTTFTAYRRSVLELDANEAVVAASKKPKVNSKSTTCRSDAHVLTTAGDDLS